MVAEPTPQKSAPKGHKWTPEDEALVRQWYGQVPTAKLAERIGVSVRAVSLKASYLGVGAPRSPRHHWTEADDDLVRREYQQTHESARRIAALLGVSFHAAHSRAMTLGLAKKTGRRPWTQGESERLEQLLDRGLPLTTCAARLGRSKDAVKIHANRYLRRQIRDRDTWYTKREVCEILGVDHKRVQGWIDQGALAASWHHARRPQQHGMAAWHIERDDLKRFLQSYPYEVTGRNIDLPIVVDLLAGITPAAKKAPPRLKPPPQRDPENQQGNPWGLSPPQLSVLALLAEGRSDGSIAERVGEGWKKNRIYREIYPAVLLHTAHEDPDYDGRVVVANQYWAWAEQPYPLLGDAGLARRRWGLTGKPWEVLKLLAQGYSPSFIAARLGISDSTAQAHTNNVYHAVIPPEFRAKRDYYQRALAANQYHAARQIENQ